ncbi:UDP-N-acetylmuramate dehydrogenase [Spiribacter pallidus]|uniref:UDP-N-acetylenolpyruvoylglucosamine reductase n=1 Tax=Spiribacter pallidus TaxID=1987936 RepID=A0ABV3TA79_9GAMM
MNMLRGRLRQGVAMARYTTWRVGGPADQLYEPADASDLGAFMGSDQRLEPLFWLGLGSNLLVRDGGVRGTVIRLQKGLGAIHDLGAGRVLAEAGVPCAKLARWCARQGYTGAGYLIGIPGTIGGALAMNAGAWGGETWRIIEAVDTVDATGASRRRPAADYQAGYRSLRGPDDEWFTAALFAFGTGGDPAALESEIRSLLAERAERQPTGMASGGSVFRNPPGDHAARLIERAGLKGAREGGARVSVKHANFIVHEGSASAADIEALIQRIRQTVRQTHGVDLEPEVRIVGEALHHGH